MPHISKEALDPVYLQKLFTELEQLIASTTKRDSSAVLNALLTETEKVMLTKRLAAAMMYSKGYSQYQVWNLLKISSSTAERMKLAFETGQYRALLKIVDHQGSHELWNILEVIVRGGLPTRGKDRWKSMR